MRQRTSWKQTPRSASTQRTAEETRQADDLYTMNRDGGNPQPAANEYESGEPSTWAEDVNSGSSVEKEYQGGSVKRNEIGLPEFRDDSFNHAGTRPWGKGGQYDNAKLAMSRKAEACARLARALLRSGDEKMIEATAADLMHLPPKAIVATLKRMDQASPSALSQEARYRRAMACTKLSALILSSGAEEAAVERLARLFNSLDDVTLKGILNVVASSRVAEVETTSCEGEGKGDGDKDEDDEHAASSAPVAADKDDKDDKDEDEDDDEDDDKDDGVLTESDLSKLREMMEEVTETAEGGEGQGEGQGEGAEDLQQLFEGGEGQGEGAQGEGAQGGSPIDISFDEGDEPEGKPAMASDLNGIFDNEENLAQREIVAAGSFNQRTASTKGAKKLGQVRAAKSEDNLESLWERPQQ